MPRQRLIAIVFMTASALAIGGWLLFERASSKRAAIAAPTGSHPLVDEKGVGVIYKLDPKMQDTLVNAVEHYCVKQYHRESCVHHLSTCGNPCLVVIPQNLRVQIFNDYQRIRKEKGLPMLLKMPPRPED